MASDDVPPAPTQWCLRDLQAAYAVTMGDRGRLGVPAELRERAGLSTGTPLLLVESPTGLVVMTRQQARTHLQRQLEGADLVGELLLERRRAAALEDDAA
ncbi:AbrB/MazE/SpoVT family DNA-binding domain-containing protein [Georgenia sp. TF02-10]|uniref:AbrB/MazE/SpoVT family DNA-binding domain-containing protein n=1 Tax=Georgenia sp. TF02-10 TaxID=2917725 RepID=UPI001FA6D7F6|nr:AbrB/MazE/SpoVT family DNA-binding domain-containing protein [Georgenia sp. TF02-10]UNX55873.1 AbrB/MazE/SpoVT family DNA-binding domain-containing protein [Georgenia sp. TF02-10]